jgi:hypothetical protein
MIATPRNPREVLELLATLDGKGDLDALFNQVDWSGITRGQFYQIVFGRMPETANAAIAPQGWSPKEHAIDAVTSDEFQREIRERILAAFPEKRRLIFVHIPKCAGTDLIEGLTPRFPRVYEDLSIPRWVHGPKFFLYLKNFVAMLPESDSIFVHGHVPLPWYIDKNLCRFGDRVFTVVRDPLDILISQVNYVLKRFLDHPTLSLPDVKIWAEFLGIDSFDVDVPFEKFVEMGRRMLYDQRIVPPNYLCTYLGTGTAGSALEAACRSNIEITDIARYSEWLSQTWGLATRRSNRSPRIVSLERLDKGDIAYLRSISHEDTVLHERILAALERSGTNSIHGTELFAQMDKVLNLKKPGVLPDQSEGVRSDQRRA